MKRYVAALLVVLGLVGVVGVLAIEAGYAQKENAAGAKCSEATLDGTYLFAQDGVEIKGNDQRPFAIAGKDVFYGNGHFKTVSSSNFNGQVTRKEHVPGTYKVNADCTGTGTYEGGAQADMFIAPDGSKFTFVVVKPSELVTSGFEVRATAKRVAP
jgi:hypothetical protein